MLVVANFAFIQNDAKNNWKPWHMGNHLRVLSESYLMNINMTGFRWFSNIFASSALDESSLSIGRAKHPADLGPE